MKDKISGEHKFSVYNDPESVNYVNITNKEPIYQKFSVYNKKINAIVLRTSKEEKIEGYSQLNYKVYYGKKIVIDDNVDLNNIPEDTDITIYLKKELSNVDNQDLKLSLELKSGSEFSLQSSKSGNLCMSIISRETTNYMKCVYTIGVILIIFSIIAYLCLYKFNIAIHKVFFISAIVLGCVVCFLIPIDNVPDEENAHITTAYHYSNVFLGIKDDKHNVRVRSSDLDTMYGFSYINNNKFVKYIQLMKDNSNVNETLVNSNMEILDFGSFSFTYYLSAIGISIGRILGLNGILCLLLGRLLNFILFLGVATYSIKNLQCFKNIATFVCLLPMTLQQVFSLSYDSIVISLSILILTLTLNLFYTKKISARQTILLVISCLLISICKHFAYAPIILAPLSYLLTKIDFSKVKTILAKRSFKIILIVFIIVCLILGCFLLLNLKSHAVEGTMLYLFVHPKLLYLSIRDTLYDKVEFYMSSAMCNSMGLCHISVHYGIIISYYILMFYVIINSNNRKNIMPPYVSLIFAILFLISFFGIIVSMYTWSYSTGIFQTRVVSGVQGRYMLPVIPFLLTAIASNCNPIKNDRQVNKTVLYSSIYLNILTMFSIMITLGH